MFHEGEGVPQDWDVAMNWWQKAADQGDDDAEFNLTLLLNDIANCICSGEDYPRALEGLFCKGGDAIERGDFAEAAKLYREAADGGHGGAQFNLGRHYYSGHGVPQDYSEAIKWFRLAADQGIAVAEYSLGIVYAKGEGVPQDWAEAISWFRRAAEHRFAEAEYSLGCRYYNGEGVARDHVRAYMWFNRAARNPCDFERRDVAIKNCDYIAGLLSEAQIAEAQRLAREWDANHAS